MRVPQKQEASALVLEAMTALKEGGMLQKWGAALAEPFPRRNVFMGDLKRVGVLNPQAIGVASIREDLVSIFRNLGSPCACNQRKSLRLRGAGDDKAFLFAVVGSTRWGAPCRHAHDTALFPFMQYARHHDSSITNISLCLCSVVAVAAQFLPGDWGFFVPYLVGGISIAVLAIGSTAPGLLQFFIGK
jgi:hypothetical protein